MHALVNGDCRWRVTTTGTKRKRKRMMDGSVEESVVMSAGAGSSLVMIRVVAVAAIVALNTVTRQHK